MHHQRYGRCTARDPCGRPDCRPSKTVLPPCCCSNAPCCIHHASSPLDRETHSANLNMRTHMEITQQTTLEKSPESTATRPVSAADVSHSRKRHHHHKSVKKTEKRTVTRKRYSPGRPLTPPPASQLYPLPPVEQDVTTREKPTKPSQPTTVTKRAIPYVKLNDLIVL